MSRPASHPCAAAALGMIAAILFILFMATAGLLSLGGIHA
jgi:hypothetical protein